MPSADIQATKKIPRGIALIRLSERQTAISLRYRQPFNFQSLGSLSTVPLMINTLADALSGYFFVHAQRDAFDHGKTTNVLTGTEFTKEEIARWQAALIGTQQVLKTNLDSFAYWGEKARFYDPRIHAAAMRYLDEHGGIAALQNRLRINYAAAVGDLAGDYLDAAESKTFTGLNDQKIYNALSSVLGPDIDFEALVEEMIAPVMGNFSVFNDLNTEKLKKALPPAEIFLDPREETTAIPAPASP